jgi:hypothetical protein
VHIAGWGLLVPSRLLAALRTQSSGSCTQCPLAVPALCDVVPASGKSAGQAPRLPSGV